MIRQRVVFSTGIYGSGKTTFSKRFAKEHKIRYISFDSIYGYDNPETMEKVYKEMSLYESFIMDALPLNELHDSYSRLYSFMEHKNAALVIVKRPLSIWLNERREQIALGLSLDAAADHEKWYVQFYEKQLPKILSRLYSNNVYTYDSAENSLKEKNNES